MSKAQKLTLIVIIGAVVVLVGFDIYTAASNGISSTISHVLILKSKTYPAIPFALGLLMGHLFL